MSRDLEATSNSGDGHCRVSETVGGWIEWLVSLGVDHFFLAPGSRNTPLAIAIADHPQAILVQHYDERGLAFACLGYGRATGHAAAFVCTSGTAAANALPAVIESSLDYVPMLLLTADRPPELRDTSANQAIDQVKLFGGYPRWHFDLPCPTEPVTANFWYSCWRYAVHASATGPVHLNCMFREPFDIPADASERHSHGSTPLASRLETRGSWKSTAEVQHSSNWHIPGGTTIVVCGQANAEATNAAARLSDRLNCPLLCDVTTGRRGLFYDLQLMGPDCPTPDTVIHVGGRVVSKRWLTFLHQRRPQQYYLVTDRPERQDPLHLLPTVVQGDLVALCDGAVISPRDLIAEAAAKTFRARWDRGSSRAIAAAKKLLKIDACISEPEVAVVVADLAPRGSSVFIGNSMPVRDFDCFAEFQPGVQVFANRGASGIDGLIATAAGVAYGTRQRVTIVLGDLSSLHDLNSLSLLANAPVAPVLIVVNNDGGGIFHFLPVAKRAANFERLFGTPHGLTFEHAAKLFGIDYVCPATSNSFRNAYCRALGGSRPHLIEVRTNRRENHDLHQRIKSAVIAAAAGEA